MRLNSRQRTRRSSSITRNIYAAAWPEQQRWRRRRVGAGAGQQGRQRAQIAVARAAAARLTCTTMHTFDLLALSLAALLSSALLYIGQRQAWRGSGGLPAAASSGASTQWPWSMLPARCVARCSWGAAVIRACSGQALQQEAKHPATGAAADQLLCQLARAWNSAAEAGGQELQRWRQRREQQQDGGESMRTETCTLGEVCGLGAA